MSVNYMKDRLSLSDALSVNIQKKVGRSACPHQSGICQLVQLKSPCLVSTDTIRPLKTQRKWKVKVHQ